MLALRMKMMGFERVDAGFATENARIATLNARVADDNDGVRMG